MRPRTSPCDAVVIGSGPVGVATARLLAADRHVVLVDAGPDERASHRAAGMLAPTSEFRTTEPHVHALCAAAHAAYPRFVAELEDETGRDVDLRTTGTLHVAGTRDDLDRIAHLLTGDATAPAEPTAELLTRRALRALEPGLAPGVAGGVLVRGDHQVDPRLLVAALREAAGRRGAELVTGTARLLPDGRVVARTPHGERTWHPGLVVVCTGARTDAVLPHPPGPAGIRPVAGTVLRLAHRPGAVLPRHVLRGRLADREVYLVPRTHGELVVGATTAERGFDPGTRAGDVAELLHDARTLYPGIDELDLAEAQTGWRPASPDGVPVVRELDPLGPAPTRVLLATGHGRHGILLGPSTAEQVLALAETAPATGSAPSPVPTPVPEEAR